jgi:hypothetical protein
MTNTATQTNTQPRTTTKKVPQCDGDHWLRTKSGKFLWCMEDECIVHGSGRPF